MNPVVVLPVARFDWHMAVKWLRWAKAIAYPEDPRFNVVAICSPALSAEQITTLHDAGQFVLWDFEIHVSDKITEIGYFGTPNQVFKAALELMESKFPGHPMLWVEADTVPMHKGWYKAIAEEYAACGKKFLGDFVEQGEIHHMTGNAVYPPDWRTAAPSLADLPGVDPRCGWDSKCAHETLPQAARSKTIRQVWRPEVFTAQNWRKIVPEGTAIFHQDKNGTLIDVLAQEIGVPPVPGEAQICVSTYETDKAEMYRTSKTVPDPRPTIGARPAAYSGTAVDPTEILIVTCRRDLEFLRYCLLSIDKYARGFTGVTIVVPKAEYALFKDFQFSGRNIKVHAFDEWPGRGMLHHEVQICRADEWCPSATAILHMDADCMFWRPVTPGDYQPGGKPIIVRERYEDCGKRNTNRLFWRAAVEQAVGFTPVYETMVRHPNVYLRTLYPKLRALVEEHTKQKFDDFVFSRQNAFPQGFAEFPTLGAVAIQFFPANYTMVDYDHGQDRRDCGITHNQFQYIYRRDRDPLCELWSHGGIQRYRTDCENFLNGMIPAYLVK
jgi:hypothetical protein